MSGRLEGRVAVVTGATGGLGEAIARRLATDGAKVAVNHLPDPDAAAAAQRVVAAIQADGGTAIPVAADVSDRLAVEAMAATVATELGPVSVLVANAAVAVTEQRPWQELSADDWRRVCEVNVVGTFNCIAAHYDGLAASGDASVVILSSVTPLLGRAGVLHYSTSKAALVGMTRSLAREVGADGVRVNAVAPGAIETPDEAAYGSPEELADMLFSVQALHRRGLPRDVASTVAFLAGDDASFITGQLIVVDGGWVMR